MTSQTTTTIRYTVGTFRTYDRALDILEDMYANGEICAGERPLIVPNRDHHKKIVGWSITANG